MVGVVVLAEAAEILNSDNSRNSPRRYPQVTVFLGRIWWIRDDNLFVCQGDVVVMIMMMMVVAMVVVVVVL